MATFGSFEVNYYRKIPPAILAAASTCWMGVPFETAQMAYYADKTFPKELQRGYTSYWNALRRIPFEEGPYFLFKNSFPLYGRNFFQTLTLFYTYDWLKDKFGGVTYRIGDFPYKLFKFMNVAFSSWLACIISFPIAHTCREMVDFWPKPKDGNSPFHGNYRRAFVWMLYQDQLGNIWPGFMNQYFYRTFPTMFITLWIADTLGMFTYHRKDPYAGGGTASWEDNFS
mmetsp:Transcript_8349/g.7413  ORF Transcript_8349/g.7413 Transcript_8349/m.7413 type:complete len:227 (+) Transcript_8349:414-1094(+)